MLIVISDKVRVESGAPRVGAIATKELLLNIHPSYAISGYDAMGSKITLGKSMTYLDHTREVWYVYKLGVRRGEDVERFLLCGYYADKETAIRVANELGE